MNRRQTIQLGLAAAAVPCPVLAAEPLLTGHIIRLGFAAGVTPQARADNIRTFNRFKQTKGPKLIIVGRDVSVDSAFEFAQITTFTNEAAYRDYFYDPIHLAADREADHSTAIARGASFDIFPRYDPNETTRLRAIISDRAQRFKANDDRPTAPPVADRPQDQIWPFGLAFFYVARFGFPLETNTAPPAFAALMHAAGKSLVLAGRESGAPGQAQTGYSMVARLPTNARGRLSQHRAPYALQSKAAFSTEADHKPFL